MPTGQANPIMKASRDEEVLTMGSAAAGPGSGLPPGRTIQLSGRRSIFLRELPGPPGAPVLVLLHGLMVTADLNWFGSFAALGEQYRVVALDLPGHGHSPALGHRFRLDECADIVAELAGQLDIPQIVPVGYSMGGLIAQLVWHRHPQLVSGMVLCSTARNFQGSSLEQMTSFLLPGIASWMQLNPVLHLIGSGSFGMSLLGHLDDPDLDAWARQQMERTSLATTVAAMDEVTRFTSHSWISGIDVPCSVVVTTQDRIVQASRQRRLAGAIGAASVYQLDAGHAVCVREPARFAQVLLSACHSAVNAGAATR